jgi:catalase
MTFKPVKPSQEHEKWAGAAVAQQIPVSDEDFIQPNGLWEVLGRTPGQQDNFVHNVAGHLCAAKEPTRKRTYQLFTSTLTHLISSIFICELFTKWRALRLNLDFFIVFRYFAILSAHY